MRQKKEVALVIDDFASFRKSISEMLGRMGITNVDQAGSVDSAFACCKKKAFDYILCDYNLGKGRDGQHLLEELRYRKILKPGVIFIMLTAESSRDMVLSAYECKPDAYLTKPVNFDLLQTRLRRLKQRKQNFIRVETLHEQGQEAESIKQLQRLIALDNGYSAEAKRILANRYLDKNQYDLAEAIYRGALRERGGEWAALGLARIAIARHTPQEALPPLQEILESNPLCLEAYDLISRAYAALENPEMQQEYLLKATAISPRSILRQRELAHVSDGNGDIATAVRASLQSISLGENSVHSDGKDTVLFLKCAGDAIANQVQVGRIKFTDKCSVLRKRLLNAHSNDRNLCIQADIYTARAFHAANDSSSAHAIVTQKKLANALNRDVDVDTDIALFSYYETLGDSDKSFRKLKEIQRKYADDPSASKKIDRFLPEPKSRFNRNHIMAMNRAGIASHKKGRYLDAIEKFSHAEQLFPAHLGIRLNKFQSLSKQLRATPKDSALVAQYSEAIGMMEALLRDSPEDSVARTKLYKLKELSSSYQDKQKKAG